MRTLGLKLLYIFLTMIIVGCQPTQAGSNVSDSPKPTKQDLLKALNGAVNSSVQEGGECLGRITFDFSASVHWALNSHSQFKDNSPIVSREIRGDDERLSYGRYGPSILIYPGATREKQESLYGHATAGRSMAEQQHRQNIEDKLEWIKGLQKPSPSVRNSYKSQKSLDELISSYRREVAESRKVLAELDKYYHPVDLGVPGSMGYVEGSTLHGLLLKDAVLYDFNFSWDNRDTRTPAQREAWFLDFFKRFQTRKLHEIPKARGVCVPYGFIPDDGTVPFYTSVGFRYDDRPNVLYTIRTQVVDDSPITNTLLEASTRAAVGLMPGVANEEAAKHLKKRIGPHRAYIGELAAEQGGVAVQLTEGDRTFDNYSVFTGYNGWMNSHVLPFISVDMRSFTQEQTQRSSIERLKTDPPPFEESKTRLDAFLKSIRLRPTDQVMPELQ
jgi:hypothetical protein